MLTKRRILNTLTGAGLALLVLAAAFWWLAGLAPTWYAPPDASDAAAVSLGETAEYRLAEEFQKIRPPAEVWLLRIPESAINAWLATRLPAWLRGRDIDWPDGLGVPQVRAQTGRLTVAMPTAALGGRTGLLTLRPRIKSGMLSCSVTGGIGRVPLPVADRIVRTALAANLPDSEHLAAVSSAIAGDPVDPVFPLIDARAVTLTSVTCEPGAIIIAARTAAADAGD